MDDMAICAHEDKVKFLKILLPKDRYNLDEVASFLGYKKKKSVYYWLEIYEVATVKFNGSPFVPQESFIAGLLRADEKNKNKNKRQGLDFVIAEQKEFPK